MRGKDDKRQFAKALGATFTLYGQTVSDGVIRLWWNVLDGYRLDAVLAAISYHVGDYQGHGHRLPTPADVRRHLEVTLPAIAREQSREIVERSQKRIGELNDEAAQLANDVRLGLLTDTVATTKINILGGLMRQAKQDPEYRRAIAGLNFREDEEEPATSKTWVPPFLRRGIALLTGNQR